MTVKFIYGIELYDCFWWPVIKTYSKQKDGWNIEVRFLKFYFGWEKSWG